MDGTEERARAVPVRDVMTPDPEALALGERLSIAEDLMQAARVRHLPVLAPTGEVVGVVSQRDLFRTALEHAVATPAGTPPLEAVSVADAMTRDPVTIDADATMAEAARRMREHQIGCLPVLEDGRLAGIVTESDFVALFARS